MRGTRGAVEELPSSPRAVPPGGRFSTRRRLIVAFSAVLAAVLSAFALQLSALRRMESTFEEMKDHEEQMRLALELEDAFRDQYGHETRVLMGEVEHLGDYEGARGRALALMRTLSARVDEPEAIAWMEQVRGASAELDRIFRNGLAERSDARQARAAETLERSYGLLLLIEGNVDKFFRMLQEAISAVRRDLVALENAAVGWTAVLLVGTVILVAGAVLYLSRSVARPLARLSQGAAALAAGDLEARIDIDTPDEFGALAAEFNRMTVALKQHQERLVESEKLAGVGRLAAGVAHELNNPLQVMIGYLSLDRDHADPRLARHLAAIEEEALRCKRIVEDLLQLSRPVVRPTAVDLRDLCDDVVSRLRESAPPGAPRVAVHGAAAALGDAAKLRQVVFNLVKNALEAAGPAGVVGVDVGAATGEARVTVRDSGPGVAPGVKERLFEPFFTTKPSGTGLGLAVSRAIARAHGGDIEVGSAERGGAAFTLRLPRAETEESTWNEHVSSSSKIAKAS
jgi:two-component system, NtrC family, sensor kinase